MIPWKMGRQNSGYYKYKIFESKLLRMDIYLLKYPKGSYISAHRDPVPEGFEHHRINIILKRAKKGGDFLIQSGKFVRNGKILINWKIIKHRIIKFRPDILKHRLSRIFEGTRYVLSIGYLRRKND